MKKILPLIVLGGLGYLFFKAKDEAQKPTKTLPPITNIPRPTTTTIPNTNLS